MSIVIATVNSRQDGILDCRSGLLRQTTIGSSWNEVRVGMLYQFVPYNNNDAACTAESLVPASYLDWFTMGLKDSSVIPPGKAGSQFIGACFHGGFGGANAISLTANGAGQGLLDCSSYRYHSSWNGATNLTKNDATGIVTPTFATGNCAFYAQKYVVVNPGASNQTVTMSYYVANTAITDQTSTNLRNLLFTVAYTATATLTWNAASAALTLPDWFWVRLPLVSNRLRIHNVEIFKVS